MPASRLLLAANRARLESDGASPFELWQLAEEAADNRDARIRLFRHAMIHAGYLVDADEKRYEVCRVCEEKLG